MSDYPATGKLIWVNGVERTVYSEAEEVAALSPAQEPQADAGEDAHDEPTFGPPGDDAHAKRRKKR